MLTLERKQTRSMIRTRWTLREFMARHSIKNSDITEFWDRHPASISRLKKPDTMTQMSSEELDNLCNALTRVFQKRGIDYEVTYSDLLEHDRYKLQ